MWYNVGMEMQELNKTIACRIMPDSPVYTADDLLRFADETDELKKPVDLYLGLKSKIGSIRNMVYRLNFTPRADKSIDKCIDYLLYQVEQTGNPQAAKNFRTFFSYFCGKVE